MKYYIILNDVQLGPLEEHELRRLPLTPQTPVWTEGMADWLPLSQVPALAGLLSQQGQATPPGYDPYRASFGPTATPGYAPGSDNPDPMPPCPDTYLVWSILVTILCCLPFGIVAIIKSSNVTSAYQRGDYAKAVENSKSAQTWIIVSAVVGLVSCCVSAAINFAGLIGS